MFWTWMVRFIPFTVLIKVATSQEQTCPIIYIRSECSIKTDSVFPGCQVGWQKEEEWSVDNKLIAILEKGKTPGCTEPCITLQPQTIWLNCTAIQHALVKYTCRCTKDKKVEEFTFCIRDEAEGNTPILKQTTVTPELQKPKAKEKPVHIGLVISFGFAVVVVVLFLLTLKGKLAERNDVDVMNETNATEEV